jgi:hypothetical protein
MFLPLVKAEDGSCDGWIPLGGGRGVKVEVIEEKQDISKQSTDKVQYINAKVNITNTNKFTCSYIETAVLADGTCSDWKENYEKLSMVSEKTRNHYCYISLYDRGVGWGRLIPNESMIANISYYGDWIDVNDGEVEQDISKQSTLDKQHLIKEVSLTSSKKIPWKDILTNVDTLGECEDCVKNVSMIKPILWLAFDESEGNITYDKSGYENDGSLMSDSNGPTWIAGKYGNALEFGGIDDYVDITNNTYDLITGTTFSFWVKRNQLKTNFLDDYTVFGRKDLTSGNSVIGFSNNGQVYMETDTNNDLCYGTFTDDTKWHYYAFSIKNYTCNIYEDGINTTIDSVIRDNITVGKIGEAFTSKKFNGIIDEVKIYDQALSGKEINEIGTSKSEIKNSFFHSFTHGIDYSLSNPEKLTVVGNFQHWTQKITVNNTLGVDFYNITPSFSSNLKIENYSLNFENLTNIGFNDSEMVFTIPKIEKKSINTYEIVFVTYKNEDNETKNDELSNNTQSSTTGYSVFYSPTFGYVILICSIGLVVIISYFSHKTTIQAKHEQIGNIGNAQKI